MEAAIAWKTLPSSSGLAFRRGGGVRAPGVSFISFPSAPGRGALRAAPDGDVIGLPTLESRSNHSKALGAREHEKEEAVGHIGSSAKSNCSSAGLHRAPVSGGVESATSVHDLPKPALAVRNLMEQARYGHLCTVMSRSNNRRSGYPYGSLLDFVTDPEGHPVFSLSLLAFDTKNLTEESRCSLVVQIPGWSGLSNARVTLFGDVVRLPPSSQEWGRQQFIAKSQQLASRPLGNFIYYRMQNIRDIYFIGGFGTVAWVDVAEYETTLPDIIASNGTEQSLQELNRMCSMALKELLSLEAEVDDAAVISIDGRGIDVRVRQGAQFSIQRLSFEAPDTVRTLEGAKQALHDLIDRILKPKSV